jgi:hypothetical protein
MDKVAFLNSQVACAMIEAMGMQAENEIRKVRGEYPCYFESDFQSLLTKYHIGHNDVITFLND